MQMIQQSFDWVFHQIFTEVISKEEYICQCLFDFKQNVKTYK